MLAISIYIPGSLFFFFWPCGGKNRGNEKNRSNFSFCGRAGYFGSNRPFYFLFFFAVGTVEELWKKQRGGGGVLWIWTERGVPHRRGR